MFFVFAAVWPCCKNYYCPTLRLNNKKNKFLSNQPQVSRSIKCSNSNEIIKEDGSSPLLLPLVNFLWSTKLLCNECSCTVSCILKGATKLFFIHYLRAVIILFSTSLYKSAFSAYSFGKTRFSSFCVLDFCVSVSMFSFSFYFFFTFWIQCHLKRLNNIYIIREYNQLNHICSSILFSFHTNDVLKNIRIGYKKHASRTGLPEKFRIYKDAIYKKKLGSITKVKWGTKFRIISFVLKLWYYCYCGQNV